jgi:hypothetical protein
MQIVSPSSQLDLQHAETSELSAADEQQSATPACVEQSIKLTPNSPLQQ